MAREFIPAPRYGSTWDPSILDVEVEMLPETTVAGGRRFAVYAAEGLVGYVQSYPLPKEQGPGAGLPPAARKKLKAKVSGAANKPRSRWHFQLERSMGESSKVFDSRLEAIAELVCDARVPGAVR